MQADRDRLSEIQRHEAWLRDCASPVPCSDVLARVKRAVRLELEASELLEEVSPAPGPTPELMARVKARLRQELKGRSRFAARVWWPSAAVSAAACLALVAGLAWQALGPGQGARPGDQQYELAQFAESLAEVLDVDDVQLALLEHDVGDLERGFYGIAPVEWESVDADLDEVRRAIDGLGDESPLWPGELAGDDV